MDISEDDSTDSHVIQMKACPRCKTTIRRSLRYSAVIKQQLQDIDKVKVKMLRKTRRGLRGTKKLLLDRLICLSTKFTGESHEHFCQTLTRGVYKLKDAVMAALLENKVMLMERLCSMNEKMRANLRRLPVEVCKEDNLEGKTQIFSNISEGKRQSLDHVTDTRPKKSSRNKLRI